jgi:hypothetical protein
MLVFGITCTCSCSNFINYAIVSFQSTLACQPASYHTTLESIKGRSVVPTSPRISLVQRRSTSEISALGREIANLAKRLDASQHELDSPVRSARRIAGEFVAGKLDLVESQAALAAVGAQVSGTGESAAVVLGVVGSVEGGAGVGLETLQAVPLGGC